MITHSKRAIPTACTKGHAIDRHAQTTDSVFVPSQNTHTLASQRIPDIASPVIITSEKDTTRNRKCD